MHESEPDEPSKFSLLLKRFRKRLKLSQTQLATKLGVSRNSISGWERGEHEPGSRQQIDLLATALKLTPAEKMQLFQAMTHQSRGMPERALRIDQRIYGDQHPAVARDCLYLASVLLDLGDLNEAEACAARALEIDEGTFGPEGAVVASDLGQLGHILQALGDLDAARHMFERALAIAERTYGPEHMAVASNAFNLGVTLKALGEIAEARDYFQRALDIVVAQSGPEHPETLIARAELASLDEGPHPVKVRAETGLPASLGQVRRRVRPASGAGIRYKWHGRPVRLAEAVVAETVLVTRLANRIGTRPSFHRWLLRPTWPLPRDRVSQVKHTTLVAPNLPVRSSRGHGGRGMTETNPYEQTNPITWSALTIQV